MRFVLSVGLALFFSGCGGDGDRRRDAAVDAAGGDAGPDAGEADSGSDTGTRDGGGGTCSGGRVGDDCDLCTWESDEAGCEPIGPGDLFDIEAIRALSLEDLEFRVTDTITRDGGTVVVGDWNGGTFPAVTIDGRHVDQAIRSRAAIYVPDGWPATANANKALVYSMHSVGEVASAVAATIAVRFGMPVLCHAEYPTNWTELGYPERSEINGASLRHVLDTNPCVPVDYARGNYQFFAIPQRAMRAITLVQRLAESRGGRVDEVALRGFSKEGAGTWIAIAVDDRITVAAPGGHPTQDRLFSGRTWIETFGCEGEEEGNQAARGANDLEAWYLRTPAGAGYLHAFDTSRNQDLFFPRALIIDGDVHMHDMHDGLYYPFGSETPFLDSLRVNHRYVRKAVTNPGSIDDGGDEVSTSNVPILLAELLAEGPDALDTYYPRVTGATAAIDRGTLEVDAMAAGPVERVTLWWSWSEDRRWSEVGQAEWSNVELARSGGGWAGSVDLAALGVQDRAIAWFVEASNTLALGAAEYARKDASPVRFLQLPEAGTCAPSSIVTCEGF